ncbi:hypothetical protein [Nioella sp.]|jgi:uncharacterized Zn-finger protein|uniref:hypothetical protein n=1 Tax=Nioella sp. TaxID=1912091 RepID=UPI003A8BAF19
MKTSFTRIVPALALTSVLGLVACNEDSSLLEEAIAHRDAACACTTTECADPHARWFIDMQAQQMDRLLALSSDDAVRYRNARIATETCWLDISGILEQN